MVTLVSANNETMRVEKALQYVALTYGAKEHRDWVAQGLKDSKEILQLPTPELSKEPCLSVRLNWEWIDRKGENGRTFVDHLLDTNPFSEHTPILDRLRKTFCGLYQVVSLLQKDEMLLRDLFRGDYYTVRVSKENLCLPWTILFTRLYPLEDGSWLIAQPPFLMSPVYASYWEKWWDNSNRRLMDSTATYREFMKSVSLSVFKQVTAETNPPDLQSYIETVTFLQSLHKNDPAKFLALMETNTDRKVVKNIYQSLHFVEWHEAVLNKKRPSSFEEQFRSVGLSPLFVWNQQIEDILRANVLLLSSEIEEMEEMDNDGQNGDLDREMRLLLDRLIESGVISPQATNILEKLDRGSELNIFERRFLENELDELEAMADKLSQILTGDSE